MRSVWRAASMRCGLCAWARNLRQLWRNQRALAQLSEGLEAAPEGAPADEAHQMEQILRNPAIAQLAADFGLDAELSGVLRDLGPEDVEGMDAVAPPPEEPPQLMVCGRQVECSSGQSIGVVSTRTGAQLVYAARYEPAQRMFDAPKAYLMGKPARSNVECGRGPVLGCVLLKSRSRYTTLPPIRPVVGFSLNRDVHPLSEDLRLALAVLRKRQPRDIH